MGKPTYEELEERLKKMTERVSAALDIMLDIESSFKRDGKLLKRVEGFIYEK